MKQIIKLVLTIAIMLFVTISTECLAKDTVYLTVPLKKQKKEHNQKQDPEGVRMPSRPFICLISDREFLSDINPDDILSYEIWDESNKTCTACFIEDTSFCQYIFDLPGNYYIRILTDDFVYVGVVSTLM